MTTRAEYARWSGHDYPEQAQEVNCFEIEFTHSGEKIYICDYGQVFVARDENGTNRSYQPIGLQIGGRTLGGSTEQTIQLTLNGADGELYRTYIKPLSMGNRNEPVMFTYRTYIDTAPTSPVFVPPPVYYLQEATVGVQQVVMRLTSTFLPNKRAGEAYTPAEFATLYFI